MKRLSTYFLTTLATLSLLCLGACGTKNETPGLDSVQVVLPSTIEATTGGTLSLVVKDGKAPLETDIFTFSSSSGNSLICNITEVDPTRVTIKLSKSLTSGEYTVAIKRDAEKKTIGKTFLNLVAPIDFTPDSKSTVYGAVLCDGKGVPGVVISDGIIVTKTNDKGYYEMASKKAKGYVFMSVPSDYEPQAIGVLPTIHQLTHADANTQERIDFALEKSYCGDSFQMIAMGDMHLANRTKDVEQFGFFTNDLNAYIASQKGKTIYGITLGDMTWDLYWYTNSFEFPQYLNTINTRLSGIKIYHTMGNHDNQYDTTSDWAAEEHYTRCIAPNYYSFNIGKWHFVSLDDINCSKYDGTTSRNYYKDVTSEQLEWLKKDIAMIPADMPVFLTSHAQYHYQRNATSFGYDSYTTRISNTKELLSILGSREIHLVTGHTHVIYNVRPGDTIYNYTSKANETCPSNLSEHNSGAVCGTWWWTGSYTGNMHMISTDGTPAGYQIFTFDGTSIKWQYKGTGKDINYQMRSYDRNEIELSAANWSPKAAADSKFEAVNDTWEAKSTANYVYFNIWNWNRNWTISVTENGKALAPTRLYEYDPLHMICYTSYSPNGNFTTTKTNHIFRVQASSATSTLEFTLTDEFGNVYKETMTRPKAFSREAYK